MTDEEIIEKVLFEMNDNKNGTLDVPKFQMGETNAIDLASYRRIRTTLVEIGAAKLIHGTSVLEILPLGRDIVKTGGYEKYIERLKQTKAEDERLKKIQLEGLELKLNLDKFYFKYRWIPFALSLLALIISLLVAIFK
jgi:hypothetical protein